MKWIWEVAFSNELKGCLASKNCTVVNKKITIKMCICIPSYGHYSTNSQQESCYCPVAILLQVKCWASKPPQRGSKRQCCNVYPPIYTNILVRDQKQFNDIHSKEGNEHVKCYLGDVGLAHRTGMLAKFVFSRLLKKREYFTSNQSQLDADVNDLLLKLSSNLFVEVFLDYIVSQYLLVDIAHFALGFLLHFCFQLC